jgi:TPR repeat protein
MIRASIAAAILVAAAIAFLLLPTTFGAGQRRALAVRAVQLGAAPTGARLLRPLAEAGDAIAQNDLGVLLNRGLAGKRDPAEAARLLNAAASAGLARAQLNLLLIRAPCDTSQLDGTIAALEGFADAGDRRAASIAADCLEGATGSDPLPEIARRLLVMATIATATSAPDEELKFGWLLLKQLERLDGYGRAADALKPRVAQEAARYLFLAAEHGRAAAYEGISVLAARQHRCSRAMPSLPVLRHVPRRNGLRWQLKPAIPKAAVPSALHLRHGCRLTTCVQPMPIEND